jgi:hypothetical protein
MTDFTGIAWTLRTIIDEFRSISGIPDTSMYSDQQCVNLINYFYQYVLPKELKIFWGYSEYQFFCQAGVDQYLAPVGFQTVNPVAYADGWPIDWYIDPDTFFQDYPEELNKQQVATADGTNNSYSFTISAYPVLPYSVYVTDGTQVVQDNGAGAFTQVSPLNNTGSVAGTIDYTTGTVSGLAFKTIPVANASITCSNYTYMPLRPQAILYYPQSPLLDSTPSDLASQNIFVLRPVPDQVYRITMEGIQIPQSLLNYTDVPFRPDLGPLIALGAALHRFKLFNQMDQYDQYLPEYNRFKNICIQDTYEEYIYQRSVPTF